MARSRNRVIDRDKGWSDIKALIPEIKGAHVKVGVLSGEGEQPKRVRKQGLQSNGAEKPTLVQVAWWNEFGTRKKDMTVRIPARSFMRSTVDENRRRLFRMKRKLVSKMLIKDISLPKALDVLGQFAQSRIEKKIVDLRIPPNKRSTELRKGSSNPLVDTRQLGQSIRYVKILRKPLGLPSVRARNTEADQVAA
jgi:hypothetical protein